VSLGRSLVTGFIVSLHSELPTGSSLEETSIKEANSIVDSVPVCTPEILEITRWVADYYASPWGEVIKAALPPGMSPSAHELISVTPAGVAELSERESKQNSLNTSLLAKIHEAGPLKREALNELGTPSQLTRALRDLDHAGLIARTQHRGTSQAKARTLRHVRLAEATFDLDTKLTDLQRRVVTTLQASGTMPLQALLRTASVAPATVSSLQKKAVVEVFDAQVRRDPLAEAELEEAVNYVLTTPQALVLDRVETQMKKGTYGAFLLHGITGSGKTEVYIRAMRTALSLGRSAMMLVPEIALTPVFSRRLRSHFGDQVAIFHSSLQAGERFDEWTRVRNGEARVVIGTRSAVFAPVRKLGLVVIDEEHEATYRQQDSPYYNARDTAIVRAQKESATVVLGSATPSLESFQNAQIGKYELLSLPERIASRPLAAAEMVDMRNVFTRHGKPQVFADELLDAIRQTFAKGEQSIILLNRRGYSSFVLCRSCGESMQCPNCDVTLTYHRSERVIVCHYCNHRQAVPRVCPECGKEYMHFVGEGTEKLEEMLNELVPGMRIARIDRDTTVQRRSFEKALHDFSQGKIDTLVGTQMLAKGHDFPNVTLVGVVSVDVGLALPDFRSAERTFQLITQVAGRAGRGDRPGKVIIQTYHPYHYALRHACAQDYDGFFNEEIRYRQNHSYPPFVALASLLIHGPDLNRVRSDSLELRKDLDRANKDRKVRILGPAPAPLARLKGEHRFQMLIKSPSRKQLRLVVDAGLKTAGERGVNIRSVNLEIDPVSIM
jgi:primosomal protein N' (replication factor Y)